MKKIGFIVTSFLRDELLFKSIQSLLKYKQDNWEIIIVDQNPTEEKERKYSDCLYYGIPYNIGLSYARNFGVQKAKEVECDYIFIGSDSFLFNESITILSKLINNNLFDYDIIGVQLIPSTCGWEAKLNLVEGNSFELDFIDLNTNPDKWIDELRFWNCEIMRNCFVAKINVLLKTPWDENLLLGEHEDEFYRLKLAKIICGWTKNIILNKQTDKPDEYAKLRKQNFNEGIKKLKEKYNISGWVTYKNLQRAKDYYKKEV